MTWGSSLSFYEKIKMVLIILLCKLAILLITVISVSIIIIMSIPITKTYIIGSKNENIKDNPLKWASFSCIFIFQPKHFSIKKKIYKTYCQFMAFQNCPDYSIYVLKKLCYNQMYILDAIGLRVYPPPKL